VLGPSGATETRPVEIGIRNRVSAEIVSGLKEGESVVVDSSAASTGSSQRNTRTRGMRMPPMF
jgi:macrolide-specific efflux system membrane fusion protein